MVAVDPNRVACPLPDSGAQLLWVQSLHAVRRAADPGLAAAVTMRLAELQTEMSHGNDEVRHAAGHSARASSYYQVLADQQRHEDLLCGLSHACNMHDNYCEMQDMLVKFPL